MTGERHGEDSRDLGLWCSRRARCWWRSVRRTRRTGMVVSSRCGSVRMRPRRAIWPLIVDGLLTIATVELWRTRRDRTNSGRRVAWLAFAFGISMSLCANVATAPEMSVLAVIVGACPPLALLLTVEL